MKTFQYQVLLAPEFAFRTHEIEWLNKFGAEGWELVSVLRIPDPGHAAYFHYFKREIPNDRGETNQSETKADKSETPF